MVRRVTDSNPPGLSMLCAVTGPPAGRFAGTKGAAQQMPCVAPVLLALVGQSDVSARTGCASSIRRLLKPSAGQSEASAPAVGLPRVGNPIVAQREAESGIKAANEFACRL